MRRRLLLGLAPLLLLLAACEARRDYPPGYTDVGLWQGPSIRVDTEVPDQYPNGTTRDAHLVDAHPPEEEEAH